MRLFIFFKQLSLLIKNSARNQMKTKKSQIAMEYILIVGFILFVLMAAMYVFREYAISSSDTIIENKVNIVANALIDNAREIYYLGESSKKVVTVEMPEGVEMISALKVTGTPNEYYFVFKITTSAGDKELLYQSDVELRKEITGSPTIVCYSLATNPSCYDFEENWFSPGIKTFSIEAKKEVVSGTNYVNIAMVEI